MERAREVERERDNDRERDRERERERGKETKSIFIQTYMCAYIFILSVYLKCVVTSHAHTFIFENRG